jgi:hypothetical protein
MLPVVAAACAAVSVLGADALILPFLPVFVEFSLAPEAPEPLVSVPFDALPPTSAVLFDFFDFVVVAAVESVALVESVCAATTRRRVKARTKKKRRISGDELKI